jgi:CheY-like chemotaxis protein
MPVNETEKKLLLVEDNPIRGEKIRACMPVEVRARCAWARTSAAALAILSRVQFSAIMLDYELEGETAEPVAGMITTTQPRDCVVMVHSISATGARKLTEILRRAGFTVEQRPWEDCTAVHDAIRTWTSKACGTK